MVVMFQDCWNTVYLSEKQLTGSDHKTRLTFEHVQANWPTFVGDVRLQDMDWQAPLAHGFKSRLAMLSYMMLVRLANNFHTCVRCLPVDVACFEMTIPLYGGQ
eukprot:15131342-Alexandrium_andersonii.AAC.1